MPLKFFHWKKIWN